MRGVGVLLALAVASAPGAAQSTFRAALSADTVAMGDVFELLVRVPVPAGSAVYFPDTVATTEVLESHAPVHWEAEPTPDGGATLVLTYPVMAFGTGIVPVPGFDVFVSPSGDHGSVAPLPGGSVVGAWSDAPTRGAAYVRPLRVPRRGVWVTPVFTPEDLEGEVQPMPSGDVVGASWHWPSVALALLFAGVLAAVVARTVRARLAPGMDAGRAGGDDGPWTPDAARLHALRELDRLLEEGLHAEGQTLELYTRSSGIVRLYVERRDPTCGPDLTSSELTRRLRARTNGAAGTALFREMEAAEVVKFGRLRPRGEEAEEHVRSLRAWVEASGDSSW